jgi:glycerol-3-phosphate dehydrogenase (NAD(P)+)
MSAELHRMGVLGAGSFGTALAIHLARRGGATLLWGRDAARLQQMQQARENAAYLPGCAFPLRLKATADLAEVVGQSEDLLIATPSHALRDTLLAVRGLLRRGQGIACACKGLEPGSGLLVHEVIEDVVGRAHPLAVISGPTFAKELGIGLPTAALPRRWPPPCTATGFAPTPPMTCPGWRSAAPPRTSWPSAWASPTA